ncbi:hypothetical protein JCM12856_07360 [Spirochaeta dissipatitropha]
MSVPIIVLLLYSLIALPAAGAEKTRDILILNSYHPLMQWADEIQQAIAMEFACEAAAETLYVEYLDTKRWDRELLFPAQADFLMWKYRGRLPELIVATDDNALDFLVHYRDQVFPDIPVIYTGINRSLEEVQKISRGWASGIIEQVDFAGTIELAQNLLPDLRKLILIADATVTANLNLQLLEALSPAQTIEIEVLRDLPPAELRFRLQQLPENSAVLYVSYIRLSSGELYSYTGGLELVAGATEAPVFVVWDFLLGQGHAIGGKVLRGQDQGRAAALAARHYFYTGNLADPDPAMYPQSRLMLDYNAVQEQGLLSVAGKLDPLWLNRPQAIWTMYRLQLSILTVAFLSLLVLLVVVSEGRRRLRKQHRLLIRSEQELEISLATKELLIQEIHHRVKNNMQLIASMLSLESSQYSNKGFDTVAAKTRRRIHAMAAVHERLYTEDNVALVELDSYVRDLSNELSMLWLDRVHISVQTDCGQLALDIDTALPLGLLLNELVENACEHAFAESVSASPEILISLLLEQDILIVSVSDNGSGMTQAEFDSCISEQQSLGLVLVDTLTHQLEADLSVDAAEGGGTIFTLRIPVSA